MVQSDAGDDDLIVKHFFRDNFLGNVVISVTRLGYFWKICFFKNGPFPDSFSFIFVFSIQLSVNIVQYKFCWWLDLNPRTSGVRSDRSTNWATTTSLFWKNFGDYFWTKEAQKIGISGAYFWKMSLLTETDVATFGHILKNWLLLIPTSDHTCNDGKILSISKLRQICNWWNEQDIIE